MAFVPMNKCISRTDWSWTTFVECPKHNGRFDYRTGAAKGAPVCVDLKIYQAKAENGKVFINLD